MLNLLRAFLCASDGMNGAALIAFTIRKLCLLESDSAVDAELGERN